MRTPIFCVAKQCYKRGKHHQTCIDDDCTGCLPRRARHPSQLCVYHERQLNDDINDVAQCYNDLAAALIPPDLGMQPKVSGSNFKSNAFPFNDAAAQLRKQIQQALAQITTSVALQRGINPPQYTSVSYLSQYLARHAEYITTSQMLARRASSTLAHLNKQARRVAFPSGTRIIDIGPCPHEVMTPISPAPDSIDGPAPDQPQHSYFDGWLWVHHPCPGMVRAKLRSSDSLLPSKVECSKFPKHHSWDSRQWIKLRRQIIAKQR